MLPRRHILDFLLYFCLKIHFIILVSSKTKEFAMPAKDTPSLNYLERLPLCSQAPLGLGSSAAMCLCWCVILTFT